MSKQLNKGLIVSCQALKNEPLYGGDTIPKMAYAAKLGGACGIRANTVKDINRIYKSINGSLPIIGLIKQDYSDSSVYITPTLKEIKKLIKSKCDVIALDATLRNRPNGEKLEELIQYIKTHSDKEIMADVATVNEAMNAKRLNVDYISTTLNGYTEQTKDSILPNIDFLEKLKNSISDIKLVAEGGIKNSEQVMEIANLGYEFIVMGGAITRPQLITKYYVDALNETKKVR